MIATAQNDMRIVVIPPKSREEIRQAERLLRGVPLGFYLCDAFKFLVGYYFRISVLADIFCIFDNRGDEMLKNRSIPFGYCMVNGKYALNAPEAEAVK